MNAESRYHLHFSFHWQTKAAERADIYQKADSMIDAAIAGGMQRETAIQFIGDIWSSGWSEGTDAAEFHSNH